MPTSSPPPWRPDVAMTGVLTLGALAFLDSLFNYFFVGNGIHGTEGALLVVISTFLMTLAAALIAGGWLRGGWRTLFEVLLALDFLGTAAAAWLLEAWILFALAILAAIAWVVHLVRPAPRPNAVSP